MAAQSSSTEKEPLIDPESQKTENIEEERQETEKSDWQKFTEDPCGFTKDWFCTNPMANLPVIFIFLGGVFCLFGGFLINDIIIGVIGFVILSLASQQIWSLRALSEEIDTFQATNAELEVTQARLENEVASLGEKKEKLGNQVGKLEGTVTELKDFSEKLTEELSGFESLKGNLEKFAAETGADVRKILGDAQKLEKKMHSMTTMNERALLSKIAQDIEFIDQDSGMSKEEFENFFNRIPKHLQKRFHELGLTFEKVAGDDGVIDFMEIEDMISKLMDENRKKMSDLE